MRADCFRANLPFEPDGDEHANVSYGLAGLSEFNCASLRILLQPKCSPLPSNSLFMHSTPHTQICLELLRLTQKSLHHLSIRLDRVSRLVLRFLDFESPKGASDVDIRRLLSNVDSRTDTTTSTVRPMVSCQWVVDIEIVGRW